MEIEGGGVIMQVPSQHTTSVQLVVESGAMGFVTLQAAYLQLAFLHRHQTARIENKHRCRLQPDGGYLANTKTHDRFRGKTLPDHDWVFVRTGLGGGWGWGAIKPQKGH